MFTRSRKFVKDALNDGSLINTEITVCGWISNFRVQKNQGISFITLNDGSGFTDLQIIVDPQSEEEVANFGGIYDRGTKGVSIMAVGTLVESPMAGQKVELKARNIEVYGDVDASKYPISKNKLTLEHLRNFPHLRIRTKTSAAVARVRNTCSTATHSFFQLHGFKYVHTPVLTSNDCEGAGETFGISNTLGQEGEPFFGKNVNLTVSGQLHGETYASALGDIYTFGPTFRAENSNTTRHLAEFWMIEPEMCFINLEDLMNITDDYIKFCVRACLHTLKDEIEFFDKHYQNGLKEQLEALVAAPFKRMTYTDVVECLEREIAEGRAIVRIKEMENKKFKKLAKGKHVFEEPVFWGCDLGSEHEKYMTDKVVGGGLIVYDYPKEIKSFYMKENADGKTVQAMDLLVPNIGELVGGSMRIDDFEELNSKMEAKQISIPWYLDLRRYGSVPHGGFGLGFERMIMLITGIYNIRDVIPYPRYPRHCDM